MLDCLANLGRQIGQKSRPLLLDRQHLASFVSLQLAVLVALRDLNSFDIAYALKRTSGLLWVIKLHANPEISS
jgi:hypothetical protein